MLLMTLRVLTVGLMILINGDISDAVWTTHNDICKSGWMHYSGSCYKLITTKQTWTRAQEVCAELGANLATISNSLENGAVSALMPCTHIDCQAWFGLNDRVEDGHFVWGDTNQSVSWTHWGTSPEIEPNNWPTYEKGTENCVSLRPDGYWNDFSCDERMMYICESSVEEVVEELEESLGTTSNTLENGAVTDPLPRENFSGHCSSGWIVFRAAFYKVFEQKKTWSEAQKTCQRYGANLATIPDSGVNKALAALLPPLYWYVDKQAWVGLTDRDTEGTYIWLGTNRRASWTNWDEGEPNNIDFGNEDCVALLPDGYWNDAPCSTNLKFICEKSV